ncbi:SNAP receptor [Agyrium rufum]|nr:SNAP receptor [Agyrium rufum]
MILTTQITRLDGLPLAASVDEDQQNDDLTKPKSDAKAITRKLNRNSEPQASIEDGKYTIQWVPLIPGPEADVFQKDAKEPGVPYLISNQICFLTICEKSYPRKLAFTYLSDLSTEFTTTYPLQQIHSGTLRPYAFAEFDTFIQRTKKTYQDSRATGNLDRLNDELRDVTKVMTKNIEDLLYRGDSLERMGEMSGRLREDSKKYKRAAVRINWELMLKQYGPFAAVGFIVLFFFWWRFF